MRAADLVREAVQAGNTGTGDGAYTPPHVLSGPTGGQFTTTAGTSAKKPAPKAAAKAAPKAAVKPKAAPAHGVLPPPTTSRTMKLGESGDDVRNLQYALGLLGFQVPQDGTFDRNTMAAVAQAQQRLGQKPTGHASASLLRKLQDAPCVKESAVPRSALGLLQIARVVERFDPSQPRDSHGRWSLLGEAIALLRKGGHDKAARHLEEAQKVAGRPKEGRHSAYRHDVIDADRIRNEVHRLDEQHSARLYPGAPMEDPNNRRLNRSQAEKRRAELEPLESRITAHEHFFGDRPPEDDHVGTAQAAVDDLQAPPPGRAAAKVAAAKRAPAKKAAPRVTAADQAEVAKVASAFHEDWRKTRLQPDGTFEPRVKKTKDQAWIAAHGTDDVDIANSTYAELPEDWKAENKAAAEVVQGILKQRGGTVDLGDEKTRLAVGEEIHQAWLSRNDWAKGGELDVPFADLPRGEQDKDTDQLKVAMGALAPAKKAATRTPARNRKAKDGTPIGAQDRTTSAGPGKLVGLSGREYEIKPGDRLIPDPHFDEGYGVSLQRVDGSESYIEQGLGSYEQAKARIAELNEFLGSGPAPAKKATPAKAAKSAAKKVEALSSDPAVREVQVENKIRAAYSAHAPQSGGWGWVSLADIRDRLSEDNVAPAEVDSALKRLDKTPGAFLTPENDQTSLTSRERTAAISLGGQAQHLLKIVDPSQRPLPSDRASRKAPAAKKAVPKAPHPDGLDSLDEPRLRSLAKEYEIPGAGTKTPAALKAALRRKGAVAPDVTPGAAPSRDPLSADPSVRAVQVDNRVRAAYSAVLRRKADGGRNRWVGLADLRAELGDDLDRKEVDAALFRLSVDRSGFGANIVPESNQKTLTATDRTAAVRIGDQDKHVISIDDPSPRPLPAAAPKAPKVSDAEVEDRIRAAYFARTQRPGMSVSLADIRQDLGDVDRAQVDDVLKRMNRTNHVSLSEGVNPTPAQRDAAAEVGGLPKHDIVIEQNSPRSIPAPTGHVVKDYSASSKPGPTPEQRAQIEADVRAAYARLARRPGSYVMMADIRDQIGAHDRAHVDEVLVDLSRNSPDLQLLTEANQKSLTDRHRAAAVTFGGRDRHVLSIAPKQPLKPGSAAEPGRAAAKVTAARKAPTRSPDDVVNAVRRLSREGAILEELRDAKASDLRRIALELNVQLPPTARTAVERKLHIAQTISSDSRRLHGGV